jgi:hypothetical protein
MDESTLVFCLLLDGWIDVLGLEVVEFFGRESFHGGGDHVTAGVETVLHVELELGALDDGVRVEAEIEALVFN